MRRSLLALELRDFCHSIAKGTPPRSSSLVGLEVVRMMEAVDRSLASNGNRVEVSAPVELAAPIGSGS